ncbi:ABC transporter permease [Jannaschia sp. LMIT008]|uniref:ABC transporter permease n=1 Tax=Jannaschia maritima TaxID=3032585 RepID=UPI00281271E5|nr:ABC transporter permease [Jannaschia sp. LMIT008]
MTDAVAVAPPPRGMRRVLRDFGRAPGAVLGAVVFAAIVVLCVFAPVFVIHDPYDLSAFSIMDARLAPGERDFAGVAHPLGTDEQGRDLWSAIVYGLRISLIVAAVASAVSFVIGTALGLIAAYRRGWVDALVMRVVDIQLAIPSILVALVLLAVLGRGVDKTIIALVTVQWVYFARTVRASALVEMEKEYVQAAKLMGFSGLRILMRHVLPNCLPPLTVVATVEVAHAITLEATLSFLGVGLPVTEPSLGRLVYNGFQFMLNGFWWISVFPALALLVLVFSINLVSDRLRDLLNPRRRRG